MDFLHRPHVFEDKADVFSLFREALDYRKSHPEESEKIAHFVFDATRKTKLGAIFNEDIETIRNEFGALEAPGLPTDDEDIDDFRDKLWNRLQLMLDEIEAKK